MALCAPAHGQTGMDLESLCLEQMPDLEVEGERVAGIILGIIVRGERRRIVPGEDAVRRIAPDLPCRRIDRGEVGCHRSGRHDRAQGYVAAAASRSS